MNKQSVLYGVIGLVGGSLLTLAVATASVNGGNTGMMNMMGMHTQQTTNNTDTSMGMNAMTDTLRGKTGDDFDKTFISEMIVHHQGAIDMANLAKQNAKHDEVKTLANDIVAAQTKEITQMKQWQKDWGYGTDSSMGGMHMGH